MNTKSVTCILTRIDNVHDLVGRVLELPERETRILEMLQQTVFLPWVPGRTKVKTLV